MSHFSPFNLDELHPTKFQSLCNAILQDQFSRLITPFNRPGRDAGFDGKLAGLLVKSYDEMLDRPFSICSSDGTEITWAFQCKFTQLEEVGRREKSVEDELAGEIARWENRSSKPTRFIFLTNVALSVSAMEKLERIGRAAFPDFFELWHDPKISNFVAANIGLQKAYFSERTTSLDLIRVDSLENAVIHTPTRNIVIRSLVSTSATVPTPVANPEEAVRQLVEFEIAFLESNSAFFEQLKVAGEAKQIASGWVEYKFVASQPGILNFSKDREALLWIVQKVDAGEVSVTTWSQYIGEETTAGDEVAKFACASELVPKLSFMLAKAFEFIAGELKSHLVVDEYLKSLEAKILSDLKAQRIHDLHDGLRAFLRAREAYTSAKKGSPGAFYPNARRWGVRPLFGWDFLGLWDKVYRHICDMIFADRQPSDTYEFLIYLPFASAKEVIRQTMPVAAFDSELYTLNITFSQIVRGRPELLTSFLDKVDDLVQEVPDLDRKIENFERAEWAQSISKSLALYIGELGYLALSQKAPLEISQLRVLLEKATSLRFDSLLFDESGMSFSEMQERLKSFRQQVGELKKERYFAWATYAWFHARTKGASDPKLALDLLASLTTKEICALYAKNQDRDFGWLNSWFMPEGKRVAFSRSADHDIRDLVQIAIVSRPLQIGDLDPIGTLEIDSIFQQFLLETKALTEKLQSDGRVVNDWALTDSTLKSAFASRKAALDQFIRSQTELNSEKLAELNADFRRELAQQSHEGALFRVEETLTALGLKAKYWVGTLNLERKDMFVNDAGYTHHSIGGVGGWWAESIVTGRFELFIKRARELATVSTFTHSDLLGLLSQIAKNYSDDFALLMPHGAIPWNIGPDVIKNEFELQKAGIPPRAGRSGRIGEVDIYYGKIRKGEFLVVKKNSFTWITSKRRLEPQVELIDEGSDEAAKIKAKDPEVDFGLRVLVRANEDGLFFFDDTAPKPSLFRADDLETLVDTDEDADV